MGEIRTKPTHLIKVLIVNTIEVACQFPKCLFPGRLHQEVLDIWKKNDRIFFLNSLKNSNFNFYRCLVFTKKCKVLLK